MKLIVGLGNPGKEYEKTRHNVGFMALDKLRQELNGSEWNANKKFFGDVSEVMVDGTKHMFLKPTTYMNDSGKAVKAVITFYKISPEDVIVVHDEKDLPLGDVRVQFERGHAGNNGIRSIIEHLKTKAFHRVRIGIASKNERKMNDTSKFVLGKFGLFEKATVNQSIDATVQAVKELLVS